MMELSSTTQGLGLRAARAARVPLAAALVMALAAPGSALASEGAALHAQKCQSCHDSMFPGGKGEMIYAPDFRKLSSPSELRQRVETCAVRINAGWFDEEIDAVTGWLQERFYRFPKRSSGANHLALMPGAGGVVDGR